jgi:cytochrome c oxidase subunit 1
MNMISLVVLYPVLSWFCSLFVEAGPASSGWTIYPPLSALPQAIPGSGTGMTYGLFQWQFYCVIFNGFFELYRNCH